MTHACVRRRLVASLIALAVACPLARAGDEGAAGPARAEFDGVKLEFLVAKFNLAAASDPTGATEPKLAEKEVVARIRAWLPRAKQDNTDADVIAIYEKIASTGFLPAGAALDFDTSWVTDDFTYKVWWINLSVSTGPRTGYRLRIRERMIDSMPNAIRD